MILQGQSLVYINTVITDIMYTIFQLAYLGKMGTLKRKISTNILKREMGRK
jgi:hypothetical protein